jgi:hypothetical protein
MPLSFEPYVMTKTLLGITLLSFSLLTAANAQSDRWRSLKNRKLIAFDFNCARTDSFPKAALSKIVESAIKRNSVGGPTKYGDLAFAIILQIHGATIYFVPTYCGATGNCTWRLYTINPLKYLGEINGQLIYTYQSSTGLPTIVTYGNVSASEGGLSTYIANRGKYRALRGEYRIDPRRFNGHRMPKFLETAKPQCKDYGS